MMTLECFRLGPHAPEIRPGRLERPWMEAHSKRFPYNCLPLNIANTTGWEVLCPFGFEATWDGGLGVEAIELRRDGVDVVEERELCEEAQLPAPFVESHFTHGVLTFNLGWQFRTPPGYDVMVTGLPNHFKHGIQPMTGVIETDWLPYPFTMNWLFTAPGAVRFEEGEPFAFIRVIEHRGMDAVQPVIRDLASEPDLAARHAAWLRARQTAAPEQNRCYIRGTPPLGDDLWPDDHITKRRLTCPVTGEQA